MAHTLIEVPLNRVEGDLEIRVAVEGGVVVDAWSSGTLFRGFENLLKGRGALDGLVLTPRICGICTTAHLTAAVKALESAAGVTPPPDAVRVRNVAQIAELLQSDVRHATLTFCADFTHPAYAREPLYPEAVRRFAPLRGEAVIETVRETKRVIEIVAILGGQWPHSSFMVPGGVASVVSQADVQQCLLLLDQFRIFYERRVLGCPLARFGEIASVDDLAAWLDEDARHREGDLGFFLRYARAVGLERLGRGHERFLSVGSLDLPAGTGLAGPPGSPQLIPAGLAQGVAVRPFDPAQIAEDVSHSWYRNTSGPRPPGSGETVPYATGREARQYSWAKAPRYEAAPAETGPLAEAVVAAHPLLVDLLRRAGASVLARELARLTRPVRLIPAMATWLEELLGAEGHYYTAVGDIEEGEGHGLIEATRGALGHWVRIEKGKIAHYQIITPTTWNASPRDDAGTRGPCEEALIGTPATDLDDPVAIGHVVRSFDHCLVCTVHALDAPSPGPRRPSI